MLNKQMIYQIRSLRSHGNSINEIVSVVKCGKATVSKYIQGVVILPKFKEILRIKQGGSKRLAEQKWNQANTEIRKIVEKFDSRDMFIILGCLYWGEGNKKEFNLINSDPDMIYIVIAALLTAGLPLKDIKLNLRIYEGMDVVSVHSFWSKYLSVPLSQFGKYEYKKGLKKIKLKYGMCRLRIRRSERYFKLVVSVINLIRSYRMPS